MGFRVYRVDACDHAYVHVYVHACVLQCCCVILIKQLQLKGSTIYRSAVDQHDLQQMSILYGCHYNITI